MGDTSRFYESVKNKYPKLKDGTRVHLWPKENIIIGPIYDEEDGYKKSIGKIEMKKRRISNEYHRIKTRYLCGRCC